MQFKIIGEIKEPQTIAAGLGIRVLARLRQQYGDGRWRKRKGVATVELGNGEIRSAEIHWYEATGIGKREFKIKHILG
jgi:hypothetical protein